MKADVRPNPGFFIAAVEQKPTGRNSPIAEHHTFWNRNEFLRKKEELVAIYGQDNVQAGRYTSEIEPINNPSALD